MVHVNDVLGVDSDVRREEYKIAGQYRLGNIHPDDYEAIRGCFQALRDAAGGWGASTTKRARLSQLRLSATMSDRLMDFSSESDVEDLVDAHIERIKQDKQEKNPTVGVTTINGYISALKALFEWADGNPNYGDYSWYENIRRRERSTDRKDPEDMLDERDVARLREHCKFDREKAFVEFLTDTGLRRTAALQLRVKDVDLDNNTFRVNPDGAAQKGVEDYEIGRWPINDSTFFIRKWINGDHPEAPNPHPDAPLFPKVEGYYPEDRENCAASPKAVGHQIRLAADRAEIGKSTNIHSFRHACVKRLRWKYDMDWEVIRDRVAWSEDSVGKMMSVYGRLDEDERIARMNSAYGQTVDDDDDDDDPDDAVCPNCGIEVQQTWTMCPQCRIDLDDWQSQTEQPTPDFEAMDEYMTGMFSSFTEQLEQASGIDFGLPDDPEELLQGVKEQYKEDHPWYDGEGSLVKQGAEDRRRALERDEPLQRADDSEESDEKAEQAED